MRDEEKENSTTTQMQKMQALGQFAGGIAHDFNNILSIIEGHAYIAIKQLKEGRLKPEQLEKILLSTQRGAGLTRQLLSFGRQKIDIEQKTNLGEVLRQQHALLCPMMGETVELFMTVPEDPVWVNASEDQIAQIILNLALNARDAMPNGGELAVMCVSCIKRNIPALLSERYPDTLFVRLTVVDSGLGISSDVLPKIFEPFFTTKDQGKGTGLGLSLVYGIIDQIKGHIEVSSTLGEGTSFDIYLPLVSAPEMANSETDSDSLSQDLSGKTILIAEDEPELRGILTEMFLGMNMKVLSAGNGNQALVVQEDYDGEIDFLLTDVVMPEMDGVKLGDMFRSLRPDVDVVYMSGYPFMDGRKNIVVPEGAPFISKPLREDGVRKILERALARKKERLEG